MGSEAVEIKWFPWPKNGDIDKMFRLCENVTEADWEALKQHIKEHGYKFGGVYHQSNEHRGVPYIEGKKPFFCSFRAWGGLMAEIWGGDYPMYAWEYAIAGGKTPPEEDAEEPINE